MSKRKSATVATAEDKPGCASVNGCAYVALKKAVKTNDAISTYEAYAAWLASKPQGRLYLQQAIWCLAWTLARTGDKKQMRQATDGALAAERALADGEIE